MDERVFAFKHGLRVMMDSREMPEQTTLLEPQNRVIRPWQGMLHTLPLDLFIIAIWLLLPAWLIGNDFRRSTDVSLGRDQGDQIPLALASALGVHLLVQAITSTWTWRRSQTFARLADFFATDPIAKGLGASAYLSLAISIVSNTEALGLVSIFLLTVARITGLFRRPIILGLFSYREHLRQSALFPSKGSRLAHVMDALPLVTFMATLAILFPTWSSERTRALGGGQREGESYFSLHISLLFLLFLHIAFRLLMLKVTSRLSGVPRSWIQGLFGSPPEASFVGKWAYVLVVLSVLLTIPDLFLLAAATMLLARFAGFALQD